MPVDIMICSYSQTQSAFLRQGQRGGYRGAQQRWHQPQILPPPPQGTGDKDRHCRPAFCDVPSVTCPVVTTPRGTAFSKVASCKRAQISKKALLVTDSPPCELGRYVQYRASSQPTLAVLL
ncbi:hypothetical protein SKAU_G00144870 [Synaphobranchus kaupii]|uniref:Uncharacterized protein n=1 Tax=Synaphobranchus kaupii TaxID=118154 RepID=A0A9Q1FTM2_SYNKA|nr:hypothetical protein SKAU_G00144870 [Synaphobranchus kaupii]